MPGTTGVEGGSGRKPSGKKPKRPSYGAQLRRNVKTAVAEVRRLERRHRAATDPVLRQAFQLDLKKAKKRLNKEKAKLARLDAKRAIRAKAKVALLDAKRDKANNTIVGGHVGLRSSGLGIVRVGTRPRAVGDSTAVNRKHSFRRR
jgi:hypothetical protein